MRINGFYKEAYDSFYVKILVDLNIRDEHKKLWFVIENENAEYFCYDRCDGIIVMLLPELLLIGEDIESDYPISEMLYYNLKRFIPLLVKQSKNRFHDIRIKCPLTKEIYSYSKLNATGMSFGIDSMYSFYSHSVESYCSPSYKVNLITFFNHGSLNGQYSNSQEQMREAFWRGRERVQKFANKENVKILSVDSNIDEFYSLNYTKTHTYRTVGIAICFQKLIGKYFYSSGFCSGEFKVDPFEDCAYYDLLSLQMLGTENTSLISDGYEKSRFEKTSFLTQFDDVKKYLSVCWRDIDNCSECPKCIRTLAALELLGNLDEFTEVFDISKYKKNYDWYWAKILSLSNKDKFYKDLAVKAAEQHYHFSAKIYFLFVIFFLGRLILPQSILSIIQHKFKK